MNSPAATVLIVDDELPNRKLLEALLQPQGYRTQCAASGEEALAMVAEDAPDLILLDIMMPGMDGFEVARQLKANPDSAHIPIIIVTAATERSARLVGLNAGVEDFLAKPVDRAELWPRVRNLLRLKAYGDLLKTHGVDLEQQVQARAADLHRFRSAMDASADGIIFVQRSTMRFVDCNATACNLFGYGRDELLQMGPEQLTAVAPEQLACSYDEIIAGRGANELTQTQFRHKGGSQFFAEVRWHAHRDGPDWIVVGVVRDITERKKAEQTLRASEERFRAIFEQAPLGIALIDSSTRQILDLNARFADIAGRSIQDLTGMDWLQITHPDDVQADLDNMALMNSGQTRGFHMEKRYIHPDGRVVWISMTITPLKGEDHARARHLSMIQDITERKLLTIAVVASETRLRNLVQAIPDLIWLKDTQGVYLSCNLMFERFLGVSEADIIGKTDYDFVDREQADFFRQHDRSAMAASKPMANEEWLTFADGGYRGLFETIKTPMFDREGQLIGVLGIARDITARKASEDQIQSLAFSDPLTGLPNRRLLMDRLEQALAAAPRHQRQGSLLFVDLDDFKTINDALGHAMGDLLLQQVAQRLGTCVRVGDTVARLGSDEFVVLLKDLSENSLEAATQAEIVAGKIMAALNQPYQIGASSHHSTPSIGITLFGVAQLEDIGEPLKRAELAMYQAKAAGRNTLRFFDPKMQEVVNARAALEASLREALEKSQFRLYYQAQVVDAGRITGAEALVRWHDPQRGLVSPAEFIPLAEETGLILPLGRWVLETACKQLKLWASQLALAHLTVSVNVSLRQFHQADFVEQVIEMLERTGANPTRLKLELTESLLIIDIEAVIAKMNALKARGVGFSLDDFGTGYSSLSYLKRLPLYQLKIDQSFVRDILFDPNDAAIAKMVVSLANSLSLAVLAEGVENEAQRDFLARLGCNAYQGYLFSRPLPLEEFEELSRRA